MATRFANKSILVVDDEARLAESLAALLRGVGYGVRAATSGQEGLKALHTEDFDLIITDLRMDGVDGFDIMREIAERHPSTAIIVITGHASTESAIEALHQRVADYIPKPFDFDFLLSAIERVFAQQETERLKRDMVHMLTHDIKVPLSSVLGFAQLIVGRDGALHPQTPEYSEIISLNCQKILELLDNYLTNARVEEGRLECIRMPFDIVEAIEDVLRLIAVEFRKKRIAVRRDFQPLSEEFSGDEGLVVRAVSNLLSNASKYTPTGGEVVIRVAQEGGELVIGISNSGATLSEDEARTVFERYRRAASSARGTEGTGLGLHIVRCVAEAHGGTVSCRIAGGVATFTLRLPFFPA